MLNYILILLTILVALVVAIVYFGHRQLNHMKIIVNKNSSNISAIQTLLNNMTLLPHHNDNPLPLFRDLHHENELKEEDDDAEYDYDYEESRELNGGEDAQYVDDEREPGEDQEVEEYQGQEEEEGQGEENQEVEEVEEVEEYQGEEEKGQEEVQLEEVEYQGQETNNDINISVDIDEEGANFNIEVEGSKNEKEENESSFDVSVGEEIKVVELKSDPSAAKTTRQVPNDVAKNHESGFTMTSENDGKLYEVVEGKGGRMRWKMVKV